MSNATAPAASLATCLRCSSPAGEFSPLCADHDRWHDDLVARLRVDFDTNAGPTFCWRSLHVHADPDGNLLGAHVDDPIAFDDGHGGPITNEHAMEVARDAFEQWPNDLDAAFTEAVEEWEQQQADDAAIDRWEV